jgi:ADP-ribosyl-[dinitrogen reductase] hydrolase
MLSRFQGVILGVAVGDALAAPVQFLSPEEVQEHFVEVRDMMGGGWLKLRKGQFSSDTEMMLCVLESILESGTFSVDKGIDRLLKWYKTRPKGIGKTTGESLKRLSKGEPWRTASSHVYSKRNHSSAGNGAMLRSIPIALRYTFDCASLITLSADSAMITHADPLATSGVVLLNMMISRLLETEEKDPRAYCIERLFGTQQNVWKPILDEVDYLEVEDLIASGFVVDTLQSALWCFLKADSFENAMVAAINRGNDVCGLASVTGALAGAYYGVEKIPTRWLDALEHREALMSLAQRLYTLLHQ